VHVYTSPHLVRFHERIRLAGKLIDESALVALLEECEAAAGPEPITFFEITTVAAFLAFSRTPGDVVLLETGLGGRLDATNVVEHPAACCITSISMDHMQYLGETLEQIAFEKAGILKAGVPTVFGPQEPRAAAVLARRAAETRAIVYRAGREWQFRREGDELIYNGEAFPAPVLPGLHQYENAAVALAVTSLLERALPDLDITAGAKRAGLRKAVWPARLQRLTRGPLVEALPAGAELWLDGGHNEGAGQVLAQQLDDWSRSDGRSTHLIYGMLNTKAADAFLKPLAPRAASLQAIAIPGEANSFSAEDAAGKAPGAVPRGSVLEAVRSLPADAGRVLICGSLYLAGRILAENG
jgi:dihydrofolate synthase/folylpolyglutamate synthase